MKQVVRKTKIKYGEIYNQNWVVRPYHQNFQLVIMLEEQRKRKYLIKDTLKDGRRGFQNFLNSTDNSSDIQNKCL